MIKALKTTFKGVMMFQKDIDLIGKIDSAPLFNDGEKQYLTEIIIIVNREENKRMDIIDIADKEVITERISQLNIGG